MEMSNYLAEIRKKVSLIYHDQPEFVQALEEFLPTIEQFVENNPQIEANNLLELLITPERIIQFRVPWQDDQGKWQVNTGYRVQFNSAVGPFKGGLRFHPTVNESVMKFLAFEQIFKNSLTGLPIGGGKGGSNFDPKGKSDAEVMRFCQSFMTELQKYIGADIDIPAGDIGVGHREIGYLFGQYKRINQFSAGVITGKPVSMWGSLARTEATGYGLVYFVNNLLADLDQTLENKRIVVSGSGNVAIYAIQKAQSLGANVIACSDSSGYILDEEGIDITLLKEIKEAKRQRLSEYIKGRPQAVYVEGKSVWSIEREFEIGLPCATQNEINEKYAHNMITRGVKLVAEGANMPTELEAIKIFKEQGVQFAPAKAANAGGVAVSALEMSQNSERLPWTFEEVDQKLADIMATIYQTCRDTSIEFGVPGDLITGANIAGFSRVASAMLAQGLV